MTSEADGGESGVGRAGPARSAGSLVGAGLVLVAVGTAAVQFVRYCFFGSAYDPDQPIWSGWQVDLAKWVLLAVLAAGVIVVASVWVRWRRASKGQVRLRLDVGVVVLLVGLFGGATASDELQRVVRWASDHTAQAAAAKRELRLEIGDRTHPPVEVQNGFLLPVPSSSARQLLTAQDIGPGWFAASVPDPYELGRPSVATANGDTTKPSRRVRVTLNQEHWNGRWWHLDRILSESFEQYDRPDQAATALPAALPASGTSALTRFTVTQRMTTTVRSVLVTERVTTSRYGTEAQAAFAIGKEVFVITVTKPEDELLSSIVDRAVRRAVTPP